jgi:hypothetical protein
MAPHAGPIPARSVARACFKPMVFCPAAGAARILDIMAPNMCCASSQREMAKALTLLCRRC